MKTSQPIYSLWLTIDKTSYSLHTHVFTVAIKWPNKVLCGYTDILFTMTGPHVVARGQVLVPVVLPSPLASTPAAATPASVCCLTQHDIAWENSSVKAKVISLGLIHRVSLCVKVNLCVIKSMRVTHMHVCMSGYVHLLSLCVSVCVWVCVSVWPMACVSVPAERSAETQCHLQQGWESGSAHIGAHMAGQHVPAHPPPTLSHADMCTCLHSKAKCEIVMGTFRHLIQPNFLHSMHENFQELCHRLSFWVFFHKSLIVCFLCPELKMFHSPSLCPLWLLPGKKKCSYTWRCDYTT